MELDKKIGSILKLWYSQVKAVSLRNLYRNWSCEAIQMLANLFAPRTLVEHRRPAVKMLCQAICISDRPWPSAASMFNIFAVVEPSGTTSSCFCGSVFWPQNQNDFSVMFIIGNVIFLVIFSMATDQMATCQQMEASFWLSINLLVFSPSFIDPCSAKRHDFIVDLGDILPLLGEGGGEELWKVLLKERKHQDMTHRRQRDDEDNQKWNP